MKKVAAVLILLGIIIISTVCVCASKPSLPASSPLAAGELASGVLVLAIVSAGCVVLAAIVAGSDTLRDKIKKK